MARLKLNNLRSRDIWIFAAPLLAFAAILLHHTVVNVLVIEFKPGWRAPNKFSLQMGRLAKQGTVASDRANLLATSDLHLEAADVLQFYIPENSWGELSADLPASGWNWKGVLLDEGGTYMPAELRLRGDYGIHFFAEKKSLKIRPRRDRLIRDRSSLILSKKRLFQQHFLYALGSRFDLLCPTATYTRMFKNHQYYGTSLNIEAIGELFLRRRGRMPGNVYVGENIENSIHREVPAKLLGNPYIWEKSARNNRHAPEDFRELADILAVLELPDVVSRWRALRQRFDWDEAARFCAFTIVCTRAHMTDRHNLKFYVDPLSARMHPIVWDPLMFYGWGQWATKPGSPESFTRIEDCDLFTRAANRFLPTFMEDPAFIGAVAESLAGIVESQAIETTLAETEASYEKVRPFFEIDGLSVSWPGHKGLCGLHHSEATAAMVRRNAAALRTSLEDVAITWRGGEALDLSVQGFGGARFTGIKLATAAGAVVARVSILGSDVSADWKMQATADGVWQPENPIHLNGGVIRETISKLALSPVSYRVSFLAGGSSIPISSPPEFEDLFGAKIDAEKLTQGDVALSPISHDSRLLPRPRASTRTLGKAGATVHLTADLVIPRHQTLVIAAGTKVRLDPGVSIVCHGSVSVRGTKRQPVTIDARHPERPWGVFSVQGAAGVQVEVDHLVMRGGSEATKGGVYYSGMFSLHYVDQAVIRDSVFEANRFGDDGLRAAGCKIRLERCEFRGCNSDGVDFDLCQGEVFDCTFSDNGNDALDFMSSRVVVGDCRFERSGDKGISCGEDSKVSIDACLFESNRIGVEAKDGSFVYILGGRIRGSVDYGIHAYAKNWRYDDGGYVEIRGCSLDNQRDAYGDDRSRIWLINSESRGSFNGSVFAWSEEVRWDDPALLRDLFAVQLDETFEDNFVSRSDGWTSGSEDVQFDKRNNVLHARNTMGELSISREIPSAVGAKMRTLEFLLGSSQHGVLDLVLELEGGDRRTEEITMVGAGQIRPHRFPCDKGILRVHLRSRDPGCRLSLMKMRLW